MNEYYNHSGVPSPGAPVASELVRNELNQVEKGAMKFPQLGARENDLIFVDPFCERTDSYAVIPASRKLGILNDFFKDTGDGYLGLQGFSLKMKNNPGTFTSLLSNTNTAAQTYNFQDKDGEILLLENITKSGRKNVIINGGFNIWQRGTSFSDLGYCADRWWFQRNGSTAVVTRESFPVGQTDVPGNPEYYIKAVVSSVAGAGNGIDIDQPIENPATLSGGLATVSFYAKADSPRNIAIEFYQYFASSADVSGIGSQKIALTDEWNKYTVTVDIPSVAGKTIGSNDYLDFLFWLDAGSTFNTRAASLGQQSGTFYFSQVQIEPGKSATNYEMQLPADENRMCQRWYQTGEIDFCANVTSAGSYRGMCNLPVVMRTSPTVVLVNVSNTNFSTSTGSTTITSGAIMETRTANGSGTGKWKTTFTADVEF
jgi:hypothetical protein